jgi:type II secretory pathway component PulJ
MELLMASTIFIVVLSAALAPFEGFWRTNKRTEQQNVSQNQVRQTIDQLATDMRSVDGQTQLIELGGANDIVFKTADPLTNPSGSNPDNIKRVRYCLNGATLMRQEQTWTTAAPPVLPSTAACPGAAPWTTATPLTTDIVNGSTACSGTAPQPNPCPIFTYDTAMLTSIKTVSVDLIIDPTPGVVPESTELKTSITLRNQNQAPVASFVAIPTGNLHVDLDGSNAYDPEGTALTYRWCLVSLCSAAAAIGTTSTVDYVASSTGAKTFYLDVTDAGGITTEASQTVTVL